MKSFTWSKPALLAQQLATSYHSRLPACDGDLDNIVRIVKVVGFVAVDPSFSNHSAVVNGASEFLGACFGESAKHARSSVGMASLPLDAPVEVELIVEVRS